MTTAKEVPRRLLVLGGGVVGVELAQAWAWLGSSVTLVEAEDRLIGREEPTAAMAVQAGLVEAGVQVVLGTKATAARRDGDEILVDFSDGRTLSGDRLWWRSAASR